MAVKAVLIRQSLSLSEAASLLERAAESDCIELPPQKPKAYQVFIVKVVQKSKQGKINNFYLSTASIAVATVHETGHECN